MTTLILPKGYKPSLSLTETEKAIELIKSTFQHNLSSELRLRRVTAPLMVLADTGLNDDLNGIERKVNFKVKALGDTTAEVVNSLAKWKRHAIAEYKIPHGFGVLTDMNAIRPDEDLDNLHSIYVDQWDWEKHISKDERTLDFLRKIVIKIYEVLKRCEYVVYENYPNITPTLPEEITFLQAADLAKDYPTLSPKEREAIVAKKYGAVFVIGIGGDLGNGEIHDGRAPDYDDWNTINDAGHRGLNGDIILWNPILEIPYEVSSMGIRVSPESLVEQLKLRGGEERLQFDFHKKLVENRLPYTIGGGIGQSRICMFLLRKAHIGEVQASIWPNDMRSQCEEHKIYLV
ncbi:MAG: aspartate--ammonia ligase [Saprospiraceae bacterium]